MSETDLELGRKDEPLDVLRQGTRVCPESAGWATNATTACTWQRRARRNG